MPVLATLQSVSIVMYYNDHDPAHFHAINGNGAEAIVRIADLIVMKNSGLSPGEVHRVCQWASQQQGPLALAWAKARSRMPLGRL